MKFPANYSILVLGTKNVRWLKGFLNARYTQKMLDWKRESNGKTALLIKGARRVGKSTIAEEFAQKEYSSYILIDFFIEPKEVHHYEDFRCPVISDKLKIIFERGMRFYGFKENRKVYR